MLFPYGVTQRTPRAIIMTVKLTPTAIIVCLLWCSYAFGDVYDDVPEAAQYDLALVDMNSFFKTVESGIKWNGEAYDAEFVSGGFYSLDGYHPNQKGYGMLANEFIKAINNKYSATIPTTNCVDCVGIRFP